MLWTKFQNWILSAVGVFTAAIGIYLYGRQQGSLKEVQKAAEKDRANARKIEDAADRVRRADGDNATPIERLRRFKKLRDTENDL